MNRYFRYFLYLVAVVQALFGVAFLLQVPFAVQMWPLPDTTPMSFIFISSIFAAAAASTLYCLLAKEYAGLAGIGLDYAVMFTPLRTHLNIIETRRMPWRASLQSHKYNGFVCRDVRQHVRVTIQHSEYSDGFLAFSTSSLGEAPQTAP